MVLRIMVSNQIQPCTTNILKALADDKSLTLFNSIAIIGNDNGCILSIREIKLTTKQYYSRIAALTKVDLIKKSKGRYSLTVLGKIVYDAHLNIGRALNNYWKLKALESIRTSSSFGQLPKDEFIRLVDTLIDNHQIKSIILGQEASNTIKCMGEPIITTKSEVTK